MESKERERPLMLQVERKARGDQAVSQGLRRPSD